MCGSPHICLSPIQLQKATTCVEILWVFVSMRLPSLRTHSSGSWHCLFLGVARLSQNSNPFTSTADAHPPDFASTYARVLAQTFDCAFSPPMDDVQALVPLALYIERVVGAAELSFAVTAASLIILQRLYTRLPPDAHARRAECSPHLLFAGAYVLAARQYVCMMGEAQLRGKDRRASRTNSVPIAADKLANSCWARMTGYSLTEVAGMQENIAYILGRNVVVFPGGKSSDHKILHSFPMYRNLPLQHSLRNLSRMTSEELHEYFMTGGRTPRSLQSDCQNTFTAKYQFLEKFVKWLVHII